MPQKPDPLAAFGTPVGQEQASGPDPLAAFGEPVKKFEAPQQQVDRAQIINVPSSAGNIPIQVPQGIMDVINKIKKYVTPSERDMYRMGGAAVGGLASAPSAVVSGPAGPMAGGALGAVGGDAIFQMINAARGNQGQIDPNAITGAMLQGGLQEGLPAYSRTTLPNQLEQGAVKLTEQAVKPSGRATGRAVADVAPEAAPKIKFAGSSEAFESQIQNNLTSSIRDLEQAYNAVPSSVRIRSNPIVAELQKGLGELSIQGAQVPGTAADAKAYNELITWFQAHPSFTIKELRQNKQLWDNVVNYGRANPNSVPAGEAVYKEGADLTRNLINNIFPTVAKANRATHVWSTLADSLGAKLESQVGKVPTSNAQSILGGVLGGGAGYLAHGPTGAAEGAMVGSALAKLPELMQTTAWKTASIQARQAVVNALRTNQSELAARILSTGTANAINKINQ